MSTENNLDQHNMHNFTMLGLNLTDRTSITFSVRAVAQACIALTTNKPMDSDGYWINYGAWGNNGVTLSVSITPDSIGKFDQITHFIFISKT